MSLFVVNWCVYKESSLRHMYMPKRWQPCRHARISSGLSMFYIHRSNLFFPRHTERWTTHPPEPTSESRWDVLTPSKLMASSLKVLPWRRSLISSCNQDNIHFSQMPWWCQHCWRSQPWRTHPCHHRRKAQEFPPLSQNTSCRSAASWWQMP